MTAMPDKYSIDTSSLIEWWVEKYSPDVFVGIPAMMEKLVSDGRLVASRSVKDEIKDDPNAKGVTLAKWCRKQKGLYVEDTPDVQAIVAEIMAAKTKLPAKPGKGICGADPFVIARAEIEGSKCFVVSGERPSNGSDFNPNIPYICISRNIISIDFFQMMKLEGWKLK